MKRRALAFILLLLGLGAPVRAADLLLLSAGVSYIRHADGFYRATYGSGAVQPEFEVSVRIFRSVYVMGGYGAISSKGKVPEFGFEARSTQSFLSLGLGYIGTIRGVLKYKLEAGIADVMYTEDALQSKYSGGKLGYQAEAGLLAVGTRVFAGIQAGYTGATKTIGEVKFKLGGARFGVLAGIRL